MGAARAKAVFVPLTVGANGRRSAFVGEDLVFYSRVILIQKIEFFVRAKEHSGTVLKLAEGAEGFDDFVDFFFALGGFFAEGLREEGGVGAEFGEEGLEGGDLLGEDFGPLELLGGGFDEGLLAGREGEVLLGGALGAFGILEVGAEVANLALRLFGGALVVEVDEALQEDLFVFFEVRGDGLVELAGFDVELGHHAVFRVITGSLIKVSLPLPEVAPAVGLVSGLVDLVVYLEEKGDESLGRG